MPEFNADVPRFPVLVRSEFLHAFEDGLNKFEPGIVHAISSLAGRALGFHVLLNNGAHVGRLPIHALVHEENWKSKYGRNPDIYDLQLWDCFSYDAQVIEYSYLSSCRCKVILPDKKWYGGEYLFTIDYCKSQIAEDAGDAGWKCHHIVQLDCGLFAAQPNNRICFFEPSMVTPFTVPPKYKTMPFTWKTEQGHKWRTKGEGSMFYEVEKNDE
jgi:hypothetical protein